MGLVRDILHNLQFPLQGKRVLLVGAGGAAEGVLGPLLAALPERLSVVNRSVDKAEAMVARVSASTVLLAAHSFDALPGQVFDVVINATSSGLSNERLPLSSGLFATDALAYDMMYGRETPFMQYARQEGVARIADGLGMLVEQAAEAFYLWRQVRPDTTAVISAMRAL